MPDPQEGIVQEREAVTSDDLLRAGIDPERDLAGQNISDLRRYPVLSEGGWFVVIKNQKTLETISRQPWKRLGPIALTSEGLDFY